MQGIEKTPEIFQIMDNLNNVNPKIYKMDGFHYKIEYREEIKKLIERIKHHYDQSLPTEWRFIANEDKYIFTLHSYDDDSILLGIESDYKDLRLIIEYYTVFVDVHKERVLGHFNSIALSMPTYKNYDLLGNKDKFCSWYISKHIGTIGTSCSFSFEEKKIPFEVTIDYSFFDKISHTPQPLLRHVKEFFDELDSEFNFETKNSQLLPPATKKAEVKSIKKMNENDRLIKECFDKHLKDKKGNETLALTITVREITNNSDDVLLIKKETTRIRQTLVRMGIWKGKKAT